MKHLNRFEKNLFILSAIVFAVFAYFLYDDSFIFPSENLGLTQKVGSMRLHENDVRRKGVESFLWRPVVNSQTLYQKDSLFTGDSSEATIQLNDGSTIQLKENTLITLNFDQGQLELDLKFGDLSTQMAQKSQLQIKSGTEKFQIDSSTKSKVEIKKPRSQKIKLNLVEGAADVKNKKQTITLTQNSPVQVKATQIKVVATTKPEVKLETLDKSKFSLKDEKQGFILKWSSVGVDEHRLVISATSDFAVPLVETDTTKNELVVKVDPTIANQFFWKVIGLDDSKKPVASSPVQTFGLFFNDRPVIVTPAQLAQFEFEFFQSEKNRFGHSDLSWTAKQKYKIYEWQISSEASFSQVDFRGTTASLQIKSPALQNKTYFLRVRGISENQESSLWSATQTFSLLFKDKKIEPLKAPELLTKKIFFDPVKNSRSPASVQAPQVLWKKEVLAQKYEIELSKTKDFKGAVRREITENQFLWNQYKPGKYFFRVSSLGALKAKSPPSEVGEIEVKYSDLLLSPVKDILEKSQNAKAEAPSKDVSLNWTEIPKASAYLVEFDTDPEFKAPQKREIARAQAQITVDSPGTYHFRVAAIDEAKSSLTEFSKPEKMTYTFKKPLAPPTLSQPKNDMSVFLQQDIEPFIWLNWETVDKATSYELQVSQDPTFKTQVIKMNLKENRFLIREKVPLGEVYWRVKAFHPEPDLSSAWTEPRVFYLFHKKNENNFQ